MFSGAGAWHDPSASDASSEFHCWPGASGVQQALNYCPGKDIYRPYEGLS